MSFNYSSVIGLINVIFHMAGTVLGTSHIEVCFDNGQINNNFK